jgi:RHS repeat-associated protein
VLGTPVAAVNASTGVVVGEQLVAPYGQSRYTASAPTNGGLHTTLGFTGQHADTGYPGASGLDYFQARSLDPVIGRFTSADDAHPALGDPTGLDPYAYVQGMVETATDPTGNWPKSPKEWISWSLTLLGLLEGLSHGPIQRHPDDMTGTNAPGTEVEVSDQPIEDTANMHGDEEAAAHLGCAPPRGHNHVFVIKVNDCDNTAAGDTATAKEPGHEPEEEPDQAATGDASGDGSTDAGGDTATTTQDNGGSGTTVTVTPPGGGTGGASGPSVPATGSTSTSGGIGATTGGPPAQPGWGLRDSTPGWLRFLQAAGLPVAVVATIIDAVVQQGAVPPPAGAAAGGGTGAGGGDGGGDGDGDGGGDGGGGGGGVGAGLPGNGAGGGGHQFL